MSSVSVPQGICAACVYGDDCTLRTDSDRAILQCEQFELAFPKGYPQAPARRHTVTGNDHHTEGYTGLCSNCEKRDTCTYIRLEGGIWRCEEYA